MASPGTEVVDYCAAMEQCGDDREFLCELLVDLKEELDVQLRNIQENLDNSPALDGEKYDAIRRAAHVIKGASANLCCYGLQQSASDLESVAKMNSEERTKQSFMNLQTEAKKFVQHLPHI